MNNKFHMVRHETLDKGLTNLNLKLPASLSHVRWYGYPNIYRKVHVLVYDTLVYY